MTDGSASPRGSSSRRARQAARLRPQELAAARGGAREGLEWLGRLPESHRSLLYRILAIVARVVLLGVFRFRVTATGRELLPAGGGFLLVAAIHRGWMDPFLILHALRPEPRAWFLGSGPSAFNRRWKERLLHRLGGMLPVWRGGVGIDQHVAAAEAVLASGGIFVLVPEGGITGPPDRLAPFRHGAALIALRTGAPIVPLAIAGTDELYLGKRMASRVLPTTSARELLGSSWDGVPPSRDSRGELALARELTDRLADILGPAVAGIAPGTIDSPGHPRRFRRLTWLFLQRPPRPAARG